MKKPTVQANTLGVNGNFYTHLVSIFKIVNYISERNKTNLIGCTIRKEYFEWLGKTAIQFQETFNKY